MSKVSRSIDLTAEAEKRRVTLKGAASKVKNLNTATKPSKFLSHNEDEFDTLFDMDTEHEIATLKATHKILMKRFDREKAIKENKDAKPRVDLSEFINYTTVAHLIDQKVGYLATDLPQIKRDFTAM